MKLTSKLQVRFILATALLTTSHAGLRLDAYVGQVGAALSARYPHDDVKRSHRGAVPVEELEDDGGGSGSSGDARLAWETVYGWTRTIGGTGEDHTNDLALDLSGNVLITGRFAETVDFDPTDGVDLHTADGRQDVFVTKLHADGSYAWTRTFGAAGSDRAHGIAVDSVNNVLVTGGFRYTVDFDPTVGVDEHTAQDGYDIFVTRFTAEGDYAWTRTMGGTTYDMGFAIATDYEDNLLVTGCYSDFERWAGVDFDAGPGQDIHDGGGAFVAKLSNDGAHVWARTFGTNYQALGWDIAVDVSGNAFLTGYFVSRVDFDPGPGGDWRTAVGQTADIYVSKIYADGSYAWAYTVGRDRWDGGRGIALAANGDVLVMGHFDQKVDFDPADAIDYHCTNGWRDIFVTRLTSDGTYLETRTTGSTAYEEGGYAIAVSPSGDVYFAGRFELTVDFDPDQGVDEHSSNGSFDLFVTKYAGTTPPIPADLDGNGHVDLADFTIFARCCGGPYVVAPPPSCYLSDFNSADLDADDDVDLDDFAAFQTCFGAN